MKKITKKLEGNTGSLRGLLEASTPSTTAQLTAGVPSENSISQHSNTVNNEYMQKEGRNTENIKVVSAISERAGLKVEYDVTLDSDVAGTYDTATRKITLNPTHEKALDYAVVCISWKIKRGLKALKVI